MIIKNLIQRQTIKLICFYFFLHFGYPTGFALPWPLCSKQYALERLSPVMSDSDQAWQELKALLDTRINEGMDPRKVSAKFSMKNLPGATAPDGLCTHEGGRS
ncbi:hypothetical protein [Xenorhabdus hominickii]|uniref:hypothetical protein n=1 Tax=Xenorhabdus hominickii TaxID=351679 RepID=UPI001E3D2883|nr:hypothetical protein [Xenorhabdus hominickii]